MLSPLQRIAIGLATITASLAVAACNSGPDLDATEPEVGATHVSVQDNRFESPVIQVPAGTEVTWEFTGSSPHDVAGSDWGSEVQRSGTYSFTFDRPGTYDYTCTLHNGMDGRVIVTAAAGE